MKFTQKKLKFFVVIMGLILVISLLGFFQKETKSFFYSFSAPIQKIFWSAGESTSSFFEVIPKIGSLNADIANLKSENQKFLLKVADLKDIEQENTVLREALEVSINKTYDIDFTEIVGRDISQDFILIDKGSLNNIKEGMPVITQDKAIVGRINQVYETFSRVMLISHKDSSFDALVKRPNEEEREVYAIVKGQGNLKVILDLVPRDADIQEKDFVLTRSMGGVFPSNLLVGTISKVKKDNIEALQQAEINLASELSDLNYLFIITNY